MRNKNLLFLSVLAIVVMSVVSCVKSDTLPTQPAPSTVFTPGSLKHIKDSVNVGDTVYLTAAGTMVDTTKTIQAYINAVYGGATSGAFLVGTSTAPITLTRTVGSVAANGNYNWTSTIAIPGATYVAHKTTLAITVTYIYGLSLSSALPSSMSATDAGIKVKTVYVK